MLYRLEVQTAAGQPVLEAILRSDDLDYDAPGWLADRLPGTVFRWRVLAQGATGGTLVATPWRLTRFRKEDRDAR